MTFLSVAFGLAVPGIQDCAMFWHMYSLYFPTTFLHRIRSGCINTLRGAVLLLAVSVSGCTNLLFQPLPQHFITPDAIGVLHEDIYIQVADGVRLHGWKLFAEDRNRGAVLFFHGNGENISTHFANVHWLTRYGFDVYLFDYRGYGKSSGVAQLDAVVADMDSMIGYTVSQLNAAEKLIIIGHSLGGSLAIHAVAHSEFRQRIHTLVSIEAFADYHDVTQDVLSKNWLTWLIQWPFSFTVDNSYRPLNAAPRVAPIPWLIMHSKRDEMIPYYHAEALYAAASEPKKLLAIDSDHNHVFNFQVNRDLLLNYLKEEPES